MTITKADLKNISSLACLDIKSEDDALTKEVGEIMDFVEQLRAVNTKGIVPLFRPFDQHQRLREDIVTEQNCLEQLQDIAPLFEEGTYLVPKVIDSGQ